MKKISTAAALLAAGALLFGSLIVACSPHGTGIIDEVTKPDSKGPKQEDEIPEVVADPKTVVNAIWDFKTNITGKADNTTFTDADFTSKGSNDIESRSSEKEIGASLKVVGGSNIKWKDETSANPNAYGLYTGAKKISDSYAAVYQKEGYVYGKLELKTLDTAKLSFDVSSNTEGYNSWVVVTNAKGKIVAFKENLKKNEIETITTDKAVSAGTYTIWMQASRLHKVVAKK